MRRGGAAVCGSQRSAQARLASPPKHCVARRPPEPPCRQQRAARKRRGHVLARLPQHGGCGEEAIPADEADDLDAQGGKRDGKRDGDQSQKDAILNPIIGLNLPSVSSFAAVAIAGLIERMYRLEL